MNTDQTTITASVAAEFERLNTEVVSLTTERDAAIVARDAETVAKNGVQDQLAQAQADYRNLQATIPADYTIALATVTQERDALQVQLDAANDTIARIRADLPPGAIE